MVSLRFNWNFFQFSSEKFWMLPPNVSPLLAVIEGLFVKTFSPFRNISMDKTHITVWFIIPKSFNLYRPQAHPKFYIRHQTVCLSGYPP